MRNPVSRPVRHLATLVFVGAWISLTASCSSDPLIVTGEVDVTVSPALAFELNFSTLTTLVRSPNAVDGNVAGECSVDREFFSVSIFGEADATGLRSVHVSSDEMSVDIGGVVYSGLDGASCRIATRTVDPGYAVWFDVDCVLDDADGNTVTAVGDLSLEGCR